MESSLFEIAGSEDCVKWMESVPNRRNQFLCHWVKIQVALSSLSANFDLGQEFAAREFELSFIATRRMSTIPSNLVKSAEIASSTRRISAEFARIFGDEFLVNTCQMVQLARSLGVHKVSYA